MEGNFEITIDPTLRLAVTRAVGMWSHGIIDRWLAEFDDMLSKHSRIVVVRLLVDLREATTLPHDVGERLEAITGAYSHRFERVAIILPSSALAALQTRRFGSGDDRASANERLFRSEDIDSARVWLTGA